MNNFGNLCCRNVETNGSVCKIKRIFLELLNGIPAEHIINILFTSIDNVQLGNCFIEWVSSITDLSLGQVIAFDCKT